MTRICSMRPNIASTSSIVTAVSIGCGVSTTAWCSDLANRDEGAWRGVRRAGRFQQAVLAGAIELHCEEEQRQEKQYGAPMTKPISRCENAVGVERRAFDEELVAHRGGGHRADREDQRPNTPCRSPRNPRPPARSGCVMTSRSRNREAHHNTQNHSATFQIQRYMT